MKMKEEYLNITARPLAVISLARGLGFPGHLQNASCRLFRGSKISEVLEPVGKARGSKIFEIFGVGGATKISEIFGRAALPPPERFSAGFISLWLSARLLGGEHRFGTENQNLLEFFGWPDLSTRIYGLPRAAAQIAQER